MASVWRVMQIGAGLAAAGYGVYRIRQGRRDWVSKTMLTAGLTATVKGLVGPRYRFTSRSNGIWSRYAPELVGAIGSAAIQALR